MNPINAINQEFTRVVVAQWSEETEARRQPELPAARGRGIAIRALLGWLGGVARRVAGARRPGSRPALSEMRK
jgi:hypothetical protein